MPVKPPLGLGVEITTADGTRFQWGKGDSVPGNVPQNLNFSTRLGDGFADASVTLSRRIDRDYPDINLFDDVTFYGVDGSVAYEGRVGANPRSIGDSSHSMSVVCAGWMAHTRDRKTTPLIIVDRDPSSWQTSTLNRRVAVAGVGAAQGDYSATADGGGIAFAGTDGKQISINSYAELMYLMPAGVGISKLMYQGTQANTTNVAAPNLYTDDNDALSSPNATALTIDGTLHTATPAAAERYGLLIAQASATHTPAVGSPFSRFFSKVAVYGNQGITSRANGSDPDGFYASDVIRYVIGQFCPLLNTAGVQDTTYVISHLVYPDPMDPFDLLADVNKYHRWQFGVYENRTLNYGPVDLTDYDWSVDLFEPGVTLDVQGDSTDGGAYNGISVTYTDLQTGQTAYVDPDTNPADLSDSDPENPANRAGIDHWFYPPALSFPVVAADAVQIGRMILAEQNTPKGQGTISVKGHLKDRAGHWQQGWKVRAGDRVAITSSVSLSDRPRLISETSWDNDSKTLSITVEDTAQRVDAVLDRFATALSAAGLT